MTEIRILLDEKLYYRLKLKKDKEHLTWKKILMKYLE